jgi:hypothetical protein
VQIITFFIVVRLRVSDGWLTSGGRDIFALAHRHIRFGLASKHALNERRGFGKSACTREEGCLEHHVIHIEATFCLGNITRALLSMQSVTAEHFVGVPASPRSFS